MTELDQLLEQAKRLSKDKKTDNDLAKEIRWKANEVFGADASNRDLVDALDIARRITQRAKREWSLDVKIIGKGSFTEEIKKDAEDGKEIILTDYIGAKATTLLDGKPPGYTPVSFGVWQNFLPNPRLSDEHFIALYKNTMIKQSLEAIDKKSKQIRKIELEKILLEEVKKDLNDVTKLMIIGAQLIVTGVGFSGECSPIFHLWDLNPESCGADYARLDFSSAESLDKSMRKNYEIIADAAASIIYNTEFLKKAGSVGGIKRS